MIEEKTGRPGRKKMLSLLLAVLMVLSTVSVCLISASARREERLANEIKGAGDVPTTKQSLTINPAPTTGSTSTTIRPAFDDSGTCGESLTWEFRAATGELTISGTGRMTDYWDDSAPWMSNCIYILSVTISEGVTSIGAFAFRGCSNLIDVTIPRSVVSIGSKAFYYCTNLACVSIPDSVTEITGDAFLVCRGIAAFTVNGDNPAFSSDTRGVLYNKDKTVLIQYPAGNPRSIFSIPSGVTRVKVNAFYECANLESVSVPDSVTSIEPSAFSGCSGLTAFAVDTGNAEYSSDADGVLYNKDQSELILYPQGNPRSGFVIPDSVTGIAYAAFKDCWNLDWVHVPAGVTRIGVAGGDDWAFSKYQTILCSDTTGCFAETYAQKYHLPFYICGGDHTNLNGVIASVESVGGRNDEIVSVPVTLHRNPGLIALNLGVDFDDSLIELIYVRNTGLLNGFNSPSDFSGNHYTLNWEDGLSMVESTAEGTIAFLFFRIKAFFDTTEVRISGVGHNANVETVTVFGLNGTIANTSAGADDRMNWTYDASTGTLCISGNGDMDDRYQIGNAPWFLYQNSIRKVVIEDGVTGIADHAFECCENLTQVSIPDSVTRIGENAFYDCWSLKSVMIPGSVTTVCDFAFGYCTGLRSVTIGRGVQTIEPYAFCNCWNITDVFFRGTETEWNAIDISEGNDALRDATIRFGGGQPAQFVLSGGRMYAGMSTEITVFVQNNPGFIGTSMALTYDPQVLTLVAVRNGDVFGEDTFQLGGDLTAVPFGLSWLDALADDHMQDGTLVTFTFRIADDAPKGETPVTITYDAGSTFNTALQPVEFDVRCMPLEVWDRIPGDVDGSGEVSLRDMVVLRRWLVGGWDVSVIEKNCDVNADEKINLMDVALILRWLAGGWNVKLI